MDTEVRPTDPRNDDTLVAHAAATVGATDVFVFRRITPDRFVHLGGYGRGEGWAGNVDLVPREEEHALEAITAGEPVDVRSSRPVRVFGPYYQREAVLVPVSNDLLVVFGSPVPHSLPIENHRLLVEAATSAAAGIEQVSSAKRLADELELLHAVRSMAQTDAVRIHEVMRHVAGSALTALSCDLGVVYVADIDAVEAVTEETPLRIDSGVLLPAMRELYAEASVLPACVQDSSAEPPPHPLGAFGVTSHYVLPIGAPPFGVLALMHTEVRPRGFTSLCREVGLRLAESSEPLLRSALTLHEVEAKLDRVGRDARIDALTKLPNRRAWEETLAAQPPGEPVGVLVLDVDGLKNVNDERGHHLGDEYLQLVAETVASSLRDDDFLARVGGDEFAVLLPGADDLACHSIAKRIADALAAHAGLGGLRLAASIGHASTPPAASIAHAQRLADEGMYQRKQRDEQARKAPPAA